ncbi:MAG TPA: NAD(P)/FAD-dependent oxidoreductase [Polyangiaceae bacterium]|nr:NAD(P)/FAD-dependent oxidoreductase [Polyangiaceae bacterium]
MKRRKNGGLGAGPSVVIVGAGIAGLGMAIRLVEAGLSDFVVLERGETLGGTWRDNAYPGAACDVPSHLYSYSFAPNPDFSRRYSGQAEIERYLERVAEQHDVKRKIRFGADVTRATFDEPSATWTVELRSGERLVANVVVFATGQLGHPKVPAFPGASEFRGRKIHSARFPRGYDATGKHVAVIGSGASAIQIVPKLAEQATRLTLFQRTPAYVVPREDREYGESERRLFRKFPLLLKAYRAAQYLSCEVRFLALLEGSKPAEILVEMARKHLEAQVPDPALRARLTPEYPVGCKRVLISDDYYPAVQRPNVELATAPIDRFEADGIRTSDGILHRADDVVFATGFDATAFLAEVEIAGREGRRLSHAWRDGAEAYLGMTVAGFPNLFVLYGPNTNLGHNSIIFMLECQTGYVAACLERIRAGSRTIEVRSESMAAFNRDLQAALAKTVWSGECSSWYKTASGKITNNWAGPTLTYWWRTRRPDFRAFVES